MNILTPQINTFTSYLYVLASEKREENREGDMCLRKEILHTFLIRKLRQRVFKLQRRKRRERTCSETSETSDDILKRIKELDEDEIEEEEEESKKEEKKEEEAPKMDQEITVDQKKQFEINEIVKMEKVKAEGSPSSYMTRFVSF